MCILYIPFIRGVSFQWTIPIIYDKMVIQLPIWSISVVNRVSSRPTSAAKLPGLQVALPQQLAITCRKFAFLDRKARDFGSLFGRNNYPIGINTAPFMMNHYGDIFHLYVHLSVYSIYIQYCIFTCLNIHVYYSIGIWNV